MFVLALQGRGVSGGHDGKDWGPDQQDELSILASKFKKDDDKVGLYLCALAEEEIGRTLKVDGCMCAGFFWVSLALAHRAGATHDLAHILLPQVQEIFRVALAEGGLQSTDG